jgi:hypothetical protein
MRLWLATYTLWGDRMPRTLIVRGETRRDAKDLAYKQLAWATRSLSFRILAVNPKR